MAVPKLPFAGFKWNWASYQPSEGLNNSAVYLGALRAFARNEGAGKGSSALLRDLGLVQRETGTQLDLVRTPERNLLRRNSGQYWICRGLMRDEPGRVVLTPFGRDVANGAISKAEFASAIVRTMTLPDDSNYSEQQKEAWRGARLRIKPLELILGLLAALEDRYGSEEAFLTRDELVRIVVPLSGARTAMPEYAAAVRRFRQGRLNLDDWPDCAPMDNDARFAKEYLLFLSGFGLCSRDGEGFRAIGGAEAIRGLLGVRLTQAVALRTAARQISVSGAAGAIERRRVITMVLARPQQAAFRREVLAAYNHRCLLTDERLSDVLEAAHIRPVDEDGPDDLANGLCLRADVHQLFDSGHIRLSEDGLVTWSLAARRSPSYRALPGRVRLPAFVSVRHVTWRGKYV